MGRLKMIVSSRGAVDFENRVNAFLRGLDAKGSKYNVRFESGQYASDGVAGVELLAFVFYDLVKEGSAV